MNRRSFRFVLVALLIATLLAACAPQQTPTPAPTQAPNVTPTVVAQEATPTLAPPTPTPPPTAPKVVAIQPPRGAELPPDQPVKITFDRVLDPASVQVSVEPALQGTTQVEGATVSFSRRRSYRDSATRCK